MKTIRNDIAEGRRGRAVRRSSTFPRRRFGLVAAALALCTGACAVGPGSRNSSSGLPIAPISGSGIGGIDHLLRFVVAVGPLHVSREVAGRSAVRATSTPPR
jgi:hypothetical protein